MKGAALAAALTARRHGVQETAALHGDGKAAWRCDPRFLAFEWIHDLVLRKRQQALVTRCATGRTLRGTLFNTKGMSPIIKIIHVL